VNVLTTPAAGRPGGTDRKRLEAALARTGDGWKVTALTAVPVAGS
jgi:Mce-associated membrane protein